VPGVENVEDGKGLKLTPKRVAAFEPWEARALGAPPPPDYPLKLDRHGLSPIVIFS